MRKILLSMLAIAAVSPALAQWTSGTNIYNTNSGSVGIGTTTPAGKFQVYNGNYDFLISPYTVDIGLGGTSGGWARAFRIVNSSGSNGTDGGAFGVLGGGTTPSYAYMAIPTSDPTGYNSNKILSLNNSGNVGIGEPNASVGKLQINAPDESAVSAIAIRQSNATNYGFDFALDQTVDGRGYLYAINNNVRSSLMEFTRGSNIVSFNESSVGVGTTTVPNGYKFAVNGAAIATSIKVKLYSNWPDFVFKKNYKLPTLTEVKTYIDKNQHLQDMPTANEVHTNGLDLGEMNRLLLKKVEELTLYLIEKDEQLNKQQQQAEKANKELLYQHKVNQSQQEQIDSIKKQLSALLKTVGN